ncbi:M28 family metallopeptidase [Aquimarina sp. 2201CG14-23]|uniref:M28 family metallopeptidase n=1 Tax=Aquimarina mycalae TaxID=3040073 RepID=UPI0024781F87|nr:M28 family peptidase [Aquimarina sp. 2201CG14-23]MDH7445607.1 M28 family peptidase [Aquimarina sp. 2201CG14-23]
MKNYRFKTLLLLLLFCIQVSMAQSEADVREAEIINAQKDIVGKLTGFIPIKGKKKLSSRSSSSERRTTADYLYNTLKDMGLKPKRNSYNVQDKKGKQYSGANIYAEIPATNGSDEYIVLGAHYDTAEDSPGAVHNATGVALTCYVAEKLTKLSSRSINFMIVFFDQQETNMIGCRMFVKKLKDDNYNINSMHRVDYVGWDNDEDRAIELLASNISLESAYRLESGVPVFKRRVSTPETRVFSTLGYDTITITAELMNGDNSPYVHQTADKYTTVNFKYLASTSEIVYKVMRSLSR